jgi:glucose/arabinose dehydrogenase
MFKFVIAGVAGVVGLIALYIVASMDRTVESVINQVVTSELLNSAPVVIGLRKQEVELEDGTRATLRVPTGFRINVAATDLGKARFMAWSPDGRLFVPDLVDYNLSREGRVLILEDWNDENDRFETEHTYLRGLRGPNSLAFYTDDAGQDWLYLALTAHLVRYKYAAGDVAPSGEPEVIVEFPNQQSPGEVSVVWHVTRTIFFHEDRLYVSVGSGCNACEELAGSMRAMIYSMNPDGSDQQVEGKGLRNTVGIEMAEGKLYATGNGVDHLGSDAPEETLYQVADGQHYGWPYCYVQDGKNVADTSLIWDKPIDCATVPLPIATFAPRSAPLGLRYFDGDSHPALNNSFLVALHGSFDQSMGSGNEIRRVTKDGRSEIFIDGFIRNGERLIRPVDFLKKDANSFFFTDDLGGRVFYVQAE